MPVCLRILFALVILLTAALDAAAQAADTLVYTLRFPQPEHHWMEVELVVRNAGDGPLRVRMSRASPGRYAIHEFAKNIFSIAAEDGTGRILRLSRVNADEWRIDGHDGTVRVTYRIFGDHVDGTYLAIDTTHAHLNLPAALLWVPGRESSPARVTIVPPDGLDWTDVGTQLFPTDDPWTFEAPNLQYLLDSPIEIASLTTTTFSVDSPDGTGPRLFRVMVHGSASQAQVDALARDVARVVEEQAAVFGAIPRFEPGHYTLLLDYVPWADFDAMEHRNSTVVTQPTADLRTDASRRAVLGSIAHELFHVWNVERIRPADLEPFDFTQSNVSCCLWLAEGFTQYYAPLTLLRAGLSNAVPIGSILPVIHGSGRLIRSAVEMSEHAPFADAAVSNDAHDRSRTFVSYYTQGAAIALGLDLTLRVRSDGRVTLDDYMRLLWQRFGAADAPAPGLVARPYSLEDLKDALGDLAGDDFAADFFARYIEGREVVDYARLLAHAGYLLEPAAPGRAWTGELQLEPTTDGLSVVSLAPFATPVYDAGLDLGDVIVRIDGEPADRSRWNALADRAPGSTHELVVRRRDGRQVTTRIILAADPTMRIQPAETVRSLTPDEQSFRGIWLGSRVR